MVSIREDIYFTKLEDVTKLEDFLKYTIVELLEGYWRFVYKTKNDPKYYWLKINYTKSSFWCDVRKKTDQRLAKT